jgi:cytoskeletal protein CcmA (bactofilin family)
MRPTKNLERISDSEGSEIAQVAKRGMRMFNGRRTASDPLPSSQTQDVTVATSHQAPAKPAAHGADTDGLVVIGKGSKIVGEITDCNRLEIHGIVEGTIVANSLVICDGGRVQGRLQSETAEVHGQFNGQLDVAKVLDVRSTGRVEGELAYGQLAVAMGGHISGTVTNPPSTTATAAQPAQTSVVQSEAIRRDPISAPPDQRDQPPPSALAVAPVRRIEPAASPKPNYNGANGYGSHG